MKLNSNRDRKISSDFLDSKRSWDNAIDLIDKNIHKFNMILNDFKVEKKLKNNENKKNFKILNIINYILNYKNPQNYRKIPNNNCFGSNHNNKMDFLLNVSKNQTREVKTNLINFYKSENDMNHLIENNYFKNEKPKSNKFFISENMKNNNLIINNEIPKTKKWKIL